MTHKTTSPIKALNAEHPWQRIQEAIKGLRYGSVEVVIHDGKVVQIERREKKRFDILLK